MKLIIKKENTCCFTGPRPHKLPFLANETDVRTFCLREKIEAAVIDEIIQNRCDTFLCGMARGVDMLCAGIVLSLKKIYGNDIRLVCVLPCLSQAQAWPKEAQARYKSILSQADKNILLQREYTEGCLTARNRFMVEHSSRLIAVYDGASGGGTKYTIDYARGRGRFVTVIDPFLT